MTTTIEYTEEEAQAVAEAWVDNYIACIDDPYGEVRMVITGPDSQSFPGAPSANAVAPCTCGDVCLASCGC